MSAYNPVSTYRLQFCKDFTLEDARKALGYLHKLGIRTLYASPVFQAAGGSAHGYDVTDPLSINSEIGSEAEFEKLAGSLHRKRMGWLQDIVPNHMAYSAENPWIWDLLEKGHESEYYRYFDIEWDHPDKELHHKLMLPLFDKYVDQLIDEGELTLEEKNGTFQLRYQDVAYPVSLRAYPVLFRGFKEPSQNGNGFLNKAFVSKMLDTINRDGKRLKELVDELCYLPIHWRETEKRINYRRFFTINGLICTNIQDEEVFEAYHGLVHKWSSLGWINGIRVDHIDGLYDPSGYLDKLRNLVGENTYILVEKILDQMEKLPGYWPVEGTTGYDFLGMINNLQTSRKGDKILQSYYGEWKEGPGDFTGVVHRKKQFILYNRFKGELDNLTHQCRGLKPTRESGLDHHNIRDAIAAFLVYCPVYRVYSGPGRYSDGDRKLVEGIFRSAISENKNNRRALAFLKNLFLSGKFQGKKEQDQIDAFYTRCMQYTGPLMAKGVEDTAFFTHIPHISHNEVGDSPGDHGIGRKKFHRLMKKRLCLYPLTMNTLSTHDTKMGEDARARLNVLSDVPDLWIRASGSWRDLNRKYKVVRNGLEIPGTNDEYRIYQALCAHVPMDGQIDQAFTDRMKEYTIKAIREAKEHSTWNDPDNGYENGTLKFLTRILSGENQFIEGFQVFMNGIHTHGTVNSLSQVILKNTCPGVPDTYQGSETWNLNFVDPDNRRPVDFQKLSRDLSYLSREYARDASALTKRLWHSRSDGKIKQWITSLTLQERVRSPELFLKGSYTPLKVKGKCGDHVMAFLRSFCDEHLLVVLPLHTAAMSEDHQWMDTWVELPGLVPCEWEHLITRKILQSRGKINIREIFEEIPFGILRGNSYQPEKRAGILLHISSLPGEFGIGDFGPAAKEFIDFLHRAGQRYLQILPLTPTTRESGYSPYSSQSAFAGNLHFIDPYHLADRDLIHRRVIERFRKKTDNLVDYTWADQVKNILLDQAFRVFRKEEHALASLPSYREFIEKESFWIHDYAMFAVLKRFFKGLPWNEWPPEYRDRDPATLKRFRREHEEEISRIMFGQYIFKVQWEDLRSYANDRGVKIFGDMPIYIGYDSADVWSHPGYFLLKPDKSMVSVAGVPPDYFNSKGQLWGMPIYHWEAMEANAFQWWIRRLEKNMEWYDLLRLDHFRGYSAYWEVPAESESAVNGRWSRGPGNRFFDAIREQFPDMPFVAEDLGQIDEDVYDLRDRYGLPGMKVIQFGFGDDMSFSTHSPNNHSYNSIVYTGTHDNNTIMGWYSKEAGKSVLKHIKKFTGIDLNERNANEAMIRLAYSSVARLVIIPMQDWLGLDEKSRMNYPSTATGNWLWKMTEDTLTGNLEDKIQAMTLTFGRY